VLFRSRARSVVHGRVKRIGSAFEGLHVSLTQRLAPL